MALRIGSEAPDFGDRTLLFEELSHLVAEQLLLIIETEIQSLTR